MTLPLSLSRCSCATLFAGWLLALPATAQPPAGVGGPSANETLSATTSYSDTNRLESGGLRVGEVSVTSLQASFGSGTTTGPGYRFSYGLDYGHFRLDRSPGVPLPGKLQEISLPLGLAGKLAQDWTGRLMLRPGLYATSLAFSSGSVNVPVLALASFRQSADLSWTMGLRYDAWSRHTLLPFAGVNWKFAPGWELSVGMPRTGVSWQFHDAATLRAGASLQGGSFQVGVDPRPTGSSAPALGATKLDYREIRLGVGLDLFGKNPVSLLVDAGAIVSQRFEYHRRHYRLAGGTAAYGTLAVRARF